MKVVLQPLRPGKDVKRNPLLHVICGLAVPFQPSRDWQVLDLMRLDSLHLNLLGNRCCTTTAFTKSQPLNLVDLVKHPTATDPQVTAIIPDRGFRVGGTNVTIVTSGLYWLPTLTCAARPNLLDPHHGTDCLGDVMFGLCFLFYAVFFVHRRCYAMCCFPF